MAKTRKTLAMRLLEGKKAAYEVIKFPEDIHSAQGVAEHASLPPENVYKTLVVQANNPRAKPMLVMVAAEHELDLKKMAANIGEKKVQMASHKDAEKMTGLKVGGISALALLNQGFDVYLDAHAEALPFIVVSAGQRGLNVKLSIDDLIRVTGAEIIEVT